MFEIISETIPYHNFTNLVAIIKFITLTKGRPDLTLIDKKCPELVKFNFY